LRRLLKKSVKTALRLDDKSFRTSFEFTESMVGCVGKTNNHLTHTVLSKRDYQRAFADGKSQGNTLNLTMTIEVPELRKLAQDREYTCKIKAGQVTIAKQVMPIKSGSFKLLIPDASAVESWLMLYELTVKDQDKKPLTISGRKTFHYAQGSHWWTDLTSLNVDIFSAGKGSPKRIFSGIAELNLQGLIKMVNTFETKLGKGVLKKLLGQRLHALAKIADGANTVKDSVAMYYLAKVAVSLGETVFRAYGGLLSTLNNFPEKELAHYTPRPHITPEHYPLIQTEDGSTIKLTRYQSQTKRQEQLSPVILVNGMGVKASSFATETVACNLVEYLSNHGRDVWLFDYRASADSGASHRSFTVDDIARYDWPAAIDFVIQRSTVKQVQVVAHCVGSMSLLMSLLKGFTKKDQIKSIVSSQLGLHPVSNWLNNAKADLDVTSQLKSIPIINKLGNVIDMRAGTTDFDRMFDVMANQIPTPKGEECNNPTCHRILAIYGPSYLHSQLNQATHIKMADWFGPININSFEQMSFMITAGHVLDADGKNTYLENIPRADSQAPTKNNVDQLDLPITFMVGALNQEFLPQSSARTYEWLRAHNPLSAHSYRRHIFEHYGHMDCFVGKNASFEVFPKIQQWLDEYQ
jgi:predicted alpha/beta hydrolase